MQITSQFILFFIALFLFLGVESSFAQEQHQIDSIKTHNLTESNQEQLVMNYCEIAYLFGGFNTDSSLFYSEKAMHLAQKIEYHEGLAVAYLYIARGSVQNGEVKRSIENYHLALDLSSKLSDSVNMLDCYRGLSFIASYGSSQLKSLEYNLKALELAEALHDTVSLSIIFNNIGACYKNLDDYEGALEYYEKTIEIEKSLNNDADAIIIPYANIGTLKLKYHKYDEASYYFKQVHSLLPLVISDFVSVYMYLSLANYYNTIGEYDSAQYNMDAARVVCPENDCFHVQPRIFRQLGELRFNQKRYVESIICFDHSLALSDSVGISEDFSKVYKLQAQAYSYLGSFKKAYELSQKAIDGIDSLKTKRVASILEEFQEQRVKSELNRKGLELALKEQQLTNATMQMHWRYQLAIGIIVLLIVVVTFIIYFLLRMGHKNKKLKEQHELIQQQKALMEMGIQKLRLSEESLQRLNLAKDKFFSIIAHDLKSPFNAIIGFSDILSVDYDQLNDIQRKEMIDVVGNSAKTTLALLENLLTWARSQSGHILLKPNVCNLQRLANDAMSGSKPAIAMKNLNVHFDIPNDLEVWVDKETVKIVISNLLNNAIKFSQKDSEIWISGKLNQGMAELCVRDAGIGMSSDIIDGLFNLETNVQRDGTSNEKGSGLGLLLCKEFVNKNGGEIWAKSVEKQGSSFRFSMPLINK